MTAPAQLAFSGPEELGEQPEVTRTFMEVDDKLVQELRIGSATYRSSVPLAANALADHLGSWWRAFLHGSRAESDAKATAPALRIAELFSGPGGLALGFAQACAELGIDRRSTIAADQDPEALAIYRRWHGTRTATTDSVSMLVDYRLHLEGEHSSFLYEPEVVDPTWAELVGRIDVLLAGPPCQGHSHLNNRTRFTDRRNQLYLTVPAMAVALRAPVVIIENVRAVIHDRRRVVQSTETLLRSAGYSVTTGVVKAAELGWPQRRERFFLVVRLDRAPLPLESVARCLAADPRDLWWAIGDLEDEPADDLMNVQPAFSEDNVARIDWLFENDEYDLPPSERPECHREGTTYNAVYGRLYADRPAPTITTGFLTPGRGRYIHPTRRRVLTPREAARLQGFPDSYDFRPNPPALPSKASLTKWIGDAVPMPLGYVAGLAALGPGPIR